MATGRKMSNFGGVLKYGLGGIPSNDLRSCLSLVLLLVMVERDYVSYQCQLLTLSFCQNEKHVAHAHVCVHCMCVI